MGRLTYEHGAKADIEDRALAHLQIVITAKLRRGEPFMFTWPESTSDGGGRTGVWIHPRCDLVFKFFGSRQPEINRSWIEALSEAANSPAGLRLLQEPSPANQAVSTTT